MMPRPLRVLQLGKFYPVRGGVEKVMVDLMQGLAARGVQCDMLCAGERGGTRVVSSGEHSRLICSRAWGKVAATMISPSMVTLLRGMCHRYDIIHVHHPDPMACLALRASGYKGKVVLHWHSDIAKQRMLLHLYRPLQDWLLRRADVIVGTTPVYLTSSPCLRPWQHKAVCLPIGIRPVCPDARAVDGVRRQYGGRHIVFSLGRLVHYKGYRYLVEAARHLSDDYVVLIGGTGVLRDELQSLIDRWGVGHRVQLLGHVSDEQLPAYYGACRLFCLSSVQKTEAFGIVQLEAMSCGRPVVATRIPQSGVSWVNEHGVSGLNVEPCDAGALAQAITQVCTDGALYQSLAAGARRRYLGTFTLDKMIDNTLDIYDRLWINQ